MAGELPGNYQPQDEKPAGSITEAMADFGAPGLTRGIRRAATSNHPVRAILRGAAIDVAGTVASGFAALESAEIFVGNTVDPTLAQTFLAAVIPFLLAKLAIWAGFRIFDNQTSQSSDSHLPTPPTQ